MILTRFNGDLNKDVYKSAIFMTFISDITSRYSSDMLMLATMHLIFCILSTF